MTIGIYDTIALVAMVEQMKRPSNFLLDMFFPGLVNSTTEFVAVDVFVGKRRMAPFVSPLVEGKIVESLGMTTNEFKPAYVKPKTALDPFRPIRRMIGEQIGGQQVDPVDREAQNLAFELAQHVMMIDRRLEWMAASALQTGSVTISGENYPTATVNFGRDSSLTFALSSGSKWGDAGVSPAEDLLDWSALTLRASGLGVTDIIFTPGAWKQFRKDTQVVQVIQSFHNAEPSLQAAGVAANIGGQYIGKWGQFNLWLYYDWYIDPADDTEKPMLPDGTVIMGSSALNGTRAFAAIIDPELGYQPLAYAPKSWVEKDPGRRFLMTQSAPLVIPTQVNAALCARVL